MLFSFFSFLLYLFKDTFCSDRLHRAPWGQPGFIEPEGLGQWVQSRKHSLFRNYLKDFHGELNSFQGIKYCFREGFRSLFADYMYTKATNTLENGIINFTSLLQLTYLHSLSRKVWQFNVQKQSETHAIALQGSNAATWTHQDLQSSFAFASEAVDGA